jgi:hypothetical protein
LRKEGCISPGDPVIREKHCHNSPPFKEKNTKKHKLGSLKATQKCSGFEVKVQVDLVSDEGFLPASKMERWFLVSLLRGMDKWCLS